jgi:hypothetical protein
VTAWDIASHLVWIPHFVWTMAIGRKEKDDDDRWKRRAAKVADSVQDLGHRLVVVPGGAR